MSGGGRVAVRTAGAGGGERCALPPLASSPSARLALRGHRRPADDHRAATDSADQVLEGFSHYVTKDGIRRSRVEADTAFFYENTQVTQLQERAGGLLRHQGHGELHADLQDRHLSLAGRLHGGQRQRGGGLARRPPARRPHGSSTTTRPTRSRPTRTSPSTGGASTWRATASAPTRTSGTSSPTSRAAWPATGMLLPGQEHRREPSRAGSAGSAGGGAGGARLAPAEPAAPMPTPKPPAVSRPRAGRAEAVAQRAEARHAGRSGAPSRSTTSTARARVNETPDGTNYFAGGNVRLSCRGTQITMQSDSVAAYGGNVVQFIGHVKYRDSTLTMDADFGHLLQERRAVGSARERRHQEPPSPARRSPGRRSTTTGW